MHINWKKNIIYVIDTLLAVYIIIAITAWNIPKRNNYKCNKIDINISDSNNAGFLSVKEIKNILNRKKLYPLDKTINTINVRKIEETIKNEAFVKTAQCYITKNGTIHIDITQLMPIIRIKNIWGEDYYLDNNGRILPNSKYISNLPIATGYINKWFAQYGIAPIAKVINSSDFWDNQIVQINVLPNRGIEIIPRIGDHIVYIGQPPFNRNIDKNDKEITKFIKKKLDRTEKFYRYGLSKVGWNKYSYIDVEFDNQIICKRKTIHKQPKEQSE